MMAKHGTGFVARKTGIVQVAGGSTTAAHILSASGWRISCPRFGQRIIGTTSRDGLPVGGGTWFGKTLRSRLWKAAHLLARLLIVLFILIPEFLFFTINVLFDCIGTSR